MSRAVGIVVAAGSSSRLRGEAPKQFRELGGVTVVGRSVRALAACEGLAGIVVVLPPGELDGPRGAAVRALPAVAAVVGGGPTRMHSSLAGVEAAAGAEHVLVHDAARPFVSAALVAAVLEATRRHGAAVPALRPHETVKRLDGGFVAETLDRGALRLAQTPQGARLDWLRAALRDAAAAGVETTDDAQALERAGHRVALVEGEPGNVKLTTEAEWAEALRRFDGDEPALRVGTGFDVHRFGTGRPLRLGGVAFDGETGLAGHSDADVVLHAAMDAVLGAAGLGDIGQMFPDDDPRLAGADSAVLARQVAEAVRARGWRVANLDLTVLAERPRILARAAAMRTAMAACFGVDASRIGVKATTLEGLGALGRAEGIACQAVVLLARTGPAA